MLFLPVSCIVSILMSIWGEFMRMSKNFVVCSWVVGARHRQSFRTYNNFTGAVPLQRGLFT